MPSFRVVVNVAVMEKAEIPFQPWGHWQAVTPRKHAEESTAVSEAWS